MGEAGGKTASHGRRCDNPCRCGVCVQIKQERALGERAALYQLSQGDDLGEQKNYS